MSEIFSNQTTDYDGSPTGDNDIQTGTGDVQVAYSCTPADGGKLELYARPTSANASMPYILIFDETASRIRPFKASGLDYYYKWTALKTGAVAYVDG